MSRRVLIAITAAVCALILMAVGAWAWDHAKANQIADGVRIGTVPVGGLSVDEAKQKVRHDLLRPLQTPLNVTFGHRRFTISAQHLHIKANVNGMVDAAREASRQGSLPQRIWRYATGGQVDTRIHPQVSYSQAALNRFLARVTAGINRPAQDATVQPSADSLNEVPGQDGIAVNATVLRRRLEAAMRGAGQRNVAAPVERTKPKVTTDQLAQAYPVYLTVDRESFQLRLWKDLKLVKTYTIAVGMQGLATPAGEYTINDKQVNPSWHVPNDAWAGSLAGKVIPPGPADPIKARWLGFFNGAGIHGTDELSSLGTAASHGCIRMSIPDVIELYPQVPLGTPIYVG